MRIKLRITNILRLINIDKQNEQLKFKINKMNRNKLKITKYVKLISIKISKISN